MNNPVTDALLRDVNDPVTDALLRDVSPMKLYAKLTRLITYWMSAPRNLHEKMRELIYHTYINVCMTSAGME